MKKLFHISTIALLLLMGASAYAQIVSTVFTSSGAFTVPAGVTSLTIEVVGAGAAGGGNGGGGGGGGGYAKGIYSVTPGAVLTVHIASPISGYTPDTTHVNNLIFATSGHIGTYVANPAIGGGGVGGIGIGGTLANYTGGTGGGGYWTYFGGGGGGSAGANLGGYPGGNTITWTGVCLTPGGAGGISGGAPGGDGGKGAGFTDMSCVVTNPAGNGANFGGGGGGANGNGGHEGTGIGGYCKIEYQTITGVNQIATDYAISIYPNPSSGKFVIASGNEQINTIEIYNVIGDKIYVDLNFNQQSTKEIDLSSFQKGIYFIKCSVGEKTYNQKIEIE